MSTPRDRAQGSGIGGDPVSAKTSLFEYTLGLADDALVSAQRMGWWISRAPELEEDVALANIGLDQLGQARMLLTYAGEVEGAGRSEDDLAYLRDDRDFRNVKLVERPMTDFGVAMARLLVLATYQSHLYAGLQDSADETLAGVAAKAVKEVAYHVDHASQWVLRLGDGTDESHARMQAALDAEWPYVDELFAPLAPSLAGRVDRSGRPAHRRAHRPVARHRARDAGRARGPARSGRRPLRSAHRAPRPPARRDAAPPPLTPGGHMVTSRQAQSAFLDPRIPPLTRARDLAATVLDPELPHVTIADLGILRDVTEDDQGRVHVTITPTYSGCPAMETIRTDLVETLTCAGYQHVDVEFVLSPAWSTDDVTAEGRAKLAAAGIAPPGAVGARPDGPIGLTLSVRCPQCGSLDTKESSRFGSTSCKSLWVCRACREPFDHFKAL